MLGMLLAVHALLAAEESVRQTATEPWRLETTAAHNTGLAFLATHQVALSRISTGVPTRDALRNTRIAGATGIQICADNDRMLTLLGPVSATDAPEILASILSAQTPSVLAAGYTDDSALPAEENLPTGCAVPAAHIWIGAELG